MSSTLPWMPLLSSSSVVYFAHVFIQNCVCMCAYVCVCARVCVCVYMQVYGQMWEYIMLHEEYDGEGHVPLRVGDREYPVAEPSQ